MRTAGIKIALLSAVFACAALDTQAAMLGRFDDSKDLLLAIFDTKPDVDDIHAQAGLATILKNSAYHNVKYFSVTGAYGDQEGAFIDAAPVMEVAFPNKWMRADGPSNRAKALEKVVELAYSSLRAGGKIWVQEAGQSNFSAEMVRELKKKDSADKKTSFNTKKKIFIVQHSVWNEQHTNPNDLSYIKSNTTYIKIDDGNYINNTTGLNTGKYDNWSKAKTDALWMRINNNNKAKDLWAAAKALAYAENKVSTYVNPAVTDDGFDFSDTAEALYIFGLETKLKDISSFLDTFLEEIDSQAKIN